MIWKALLWAILMTFVVSGAKAEDPAIHGSHGHSWYENAELTDAAKLRFGINKCCAQAEVVRTQFRVDRTTAEDTWWWLDRTTSQWRQIPSDIIHWGNPRSGQTAHALCLERADGLLFHP